MRVRSLWLLVAVMGLGFLASACTTKDAPVPPAAGLYGDAYRLGEGDRLRITVFGHEDLSSAFENDSAGKIAFPPIGDLQVEGRSRDEVEEMIVSGLQPDHLRSPVVGVEVVENRDVHGSEDPPSPYDPSGRMFHAVLRWCGPAQRPNESLSPNWLLSHEGRCRTGDTYRSGEGRFF